jgi:hypothetical protein
MQLDQLTEPDDRAFVIIDAIVYPAVIETTIAGFRFGYIDRGGLAPAFIASGAVAGTQGCV